MQILFFSGSLRVASLNTKLVQVAMEIAKTLPEVQCQISDLKSLNIPVYDGDIEALGIPDGVKRLGDQIQAAQALIISSPEYNGSIAGSFKNIIDWISRLKPVPFEKKPILLLGASPGGFGAIRSLTANRTPLENLGAYIYPQPFALPKAHEAFLPTGSLKDAATLQKLTSLITDFHQYARKLT